MAEVPNIASMDFKKVDDEVLSRSFNTVNAWYASIKQGKKLKHSLDTIIRLGVQIMTELLRRGKVTFHPEEMKQVSREFSAKVLDKIVKQKVNVEPPYGDLIAEGKAKGLLLGEDIPLDKIYLFVQDGKALGYVRFGAMPSIESKPGSGAAFGTYHYKIVGDDFKKYQKIHRVSDEEKEQLWPKNKILWLYPVRDFFPLDKPIQLSTNLDTTLPEGLKPEDLTPDYLKQINSMTLVKIHGWLHSGFFQAQKRKEAIERWVNAHAFVVDEMINRKMEHRPWSELDEFSKQYQTHKFERAIDYLQDFLIRKPYALAAGSVFVSGEGNDLDVVIRDEENQYFKEAVLHFMSKSNLKADMVFGAWTSSFTNNVSLYDYGLTRNPRSEMFLSKIKLHGLDLQLPSFVNSQPRVFIKQRDTKLLFWIREDITKERDGIVEFKIKQMLPLYYDAKFDYGLYVPSDYKPIYWDVYLREPEPEMITMSIVQSRHEVRLARGIKIMRYFQTMKPAKAAKPGEPATFDFYLAVFKSRDFPVFLQKKYDGANLEIHRSGNDVKIWTEDGVDVTHRLPGTVEEIKKLNHNKFAALAEAEFWKGKFHYPRERAAGYLMSKDKPDDSNIVLNFYDVVATGSHGDVSGKNMIERDKVLDTFDFKQSTIGVPDLKYRLNRAPSKMAKNASELKTKSEELRFAAGSEGIVAKPFWGVYDLSGRRKEQIKFHNSVIFVARVLKRNQTKTPGVYTYKWAIKSGPLKAREQHAVMINNEEYIHGGNTDSTDFKLSKGDLIVIEAETFNKVYYEKDDTVKVSAWVPRVLEQKADKGVDSVKSVMKEAQNNRVLTIKKVHKDGSESYLPQEAFKLNTEHTALLRLSALEEEHGILPLIESLEDIRTEEEAILQRYSRDIPVPSDIKAKESKWNSISLDELEKMNPSSLPKGFFVIVDHYRGKSVHGDLRGKENGTADGWTISNAWAGKIKEPVDSFSEAQAIQSDKSVWKFNPDMPPTKHVFATPKPPHPLGWLTQVKNIHKEGEVGATRFEEGLFYGKDWGLRYHGAGGKGSHGTSKPWFFEYFLRGRKFNCKIVFRLLEAPKGGGRKVEKGIFWQAWIAKDQFPYILTRSARTKRDWLPPHGRSAIPPELEVLIPNELKWWNLPKGHSKEKMLDTIDKAYNHLIDEGWIAARKLPVREEQTQSLEGKKVPFILQYEWWKGPEVIRGMRQNKFFIKLQDNSNVQAISFLEKKPVLTTEDAGIAATMHKVSHGPKRGMKPIDWMRFEGEIGPGEPGHPLEIKKLPLHVEIMDRGSVQVIEDGELFKSLQFDGKLLKGYYVMRREGPDSKLWVWQKSKLP